MRSHVYCPGVKSPIALTLFPTMSGSTNHRSMFATGLLRRQEGKSSYGILKRGLRLLVEDIDDKDPSDIAYVYSGYAPISVRLLEAAVKGAGLAALPEDVLKSLPGPSFSIEQAAEDEPGSSRRLPSSSSK